MDSDIDCLPVITDKNVNLGRLTGVRDRSSVSMNRKERVANSVKAADMVIAAVENDSSVIPEPGTL